MGWREKWTPSWDGFEFYLCVKAIINTYCWLWFNFHISNMNYSNAYQRPWWNISSISRKQMSLHWSFTTVIKLCWSSLFDSSAAHTHWLCPQIRGQWPGESYCYHHSRAQCVCVCIRPVSHGPEEEKRPCLIPLVTWAAPPLSPADWRTALVRQQLHPGAGGWRWEEGDKVQA